MHLTGIHHLTAVTATRRGNHAFYTRTLGMRLVKKTVNQDDVSAYHLFYADGLGSPGTDLTFFDWPVARERRGTDSIVRTGLRVAGEDALPGGSSGSSEPGVEHGDIAERDGRPTLDFEDSEGQRLSLVDDGGAGRGPSLGEEPGPGRAPDPRPRPDHAQRSRPCAAPTRCSPRSWTCASARDYADPARPRTVHVYDMGEGGPAAELHVAVEPDLPPRPAGRRRRAPRRLPHAQRRYHALGRAPARACASPTAARSTASTSAASTSASRTASCSRSPPTARALRRTNPWRPWASASRCPRSWSRGGRRSRRA